MGDDGGGSYDAGCSSDYGNMSSYDNGTSSSYDTGCHTAAYESRDDNHGDNHGGFFSPVVEESSLINSEETAEERRENKKDGGDVVDTTLDVLTAAFSPNENGELPMSLLLDDDTKRTMETAFGATEDSHDPSCGEDCCYFSMLCCDCSIS